MSEIPSSASFLPSPPLPPTKFFLHKFYLHCIRDLTKDAAEAAASGSKLQPVPTIPSNKGGAKGFLSASKLIICDVQFKATPPPPMDRHWIGSGIDQEHIMMW